jgi:hypothetical protein
MQTSAFRIRDDGVGIDPRALERGSRPGHCGLQGMRERAQRIGAQSTASADQACDAQIYQSAGGNLLSAMSQAKASANRFCIAIHERFLASGL